MISFWAKTTSEGKPGISVYDHMTNVGCVACCIAETAPQILERFHLQAKEVGALVILHDLGKISPRFQQKCEEWLAENNLFKRNGTCYRKNDRRGGSVNVAYESWILVVDTSGNRIFASPCSVLTEGEKYAELAVRPHERVTPMQLFLCVAYAALDRPKNYDEWVEVPKND